MTWSRVIVESGESSNQGMFEGRNGEENTFRSQYGLEYILAGRNTRFSQGAWSCSRSPPRGPSYAQIGPDSFPPHSRRSVQKEKHPDSDVSQYLSFILNGQLTVHANRRQIQPFRVQLCSPDILNLNVERREPFGGGRSSFLSSVHRGVATLPRRGMGNTTHSSSSLLMHSIIR